MRRGQRPAQQAHGRALRRVRRWSAPEHSYAADQQQGAEDVDDPLEVRQELRAKRDERTAKHERTEDPIEEHAVLVGRGDGERGEDDGPDEDVVERQRELEQVAGEELTRELPTLAQSEHDAEDKATATNPAVDHAALR